MNMLIQMKKKTPTNKSTNSNIYNAAMSNKRQTHKKTRAISGSSGQRNNDNPTLSSQAQLSQGKRNAKTSHQS